MAAQFPVRITNMLALNSVALSDAADYRLIVTNSYGSATSQVATVTVFVPTTNNPVVLALNPSAGATVGNLTQIQVTFSKYVTGVDAEDLLIAGNPANSVSGSGSNYVFTFTQPPPGTILVDWDIDSGITDLSGNLFDTSSNWTYTLIDNIPPTIASTTPAAGATVGSLTQAQVIFSDISHRRERLRAFDQWRAGDERERQRFRALYFSIFTARAGNGAILLVAGTKYPGQRVESFWRRGLDGDFEFSGGRRRVDQHCHQRISGRQHQSRRIARRRRFARQLD